MVSVQVGVNKLSPTSSLECISVIWTLGPCPTRDCLLSQFVGDRLMQLLERLIDFDINNILVKISFISFL